MHSEKENQIGRAGEDDDGNKTPVKLRKFRDKLAKARASFAQSSTNPTNSLLKERLETKNKTAEKYVEYIREKEDAIKTLKRQNKQLAKELRENRPCPKCEEAEETDGQLERLAQNKEELVVFVEEKKDWLAEQELQLRVREQRVGEAEKSFAQKLANLKKWQQELEHYTDKLEKREKKVREKEKECKDLFNKTQDIFG